MLEEEVESGRTLEEDDFGVASGHISWSKCAMRGCSRYLSGDKESTLTREAF